LSHTVLWPNHPISVVQLPEDERGWHFGAFVIQSDPESKSDGNLLVTARSQSELESTRLDSIECAEPVAVISLFVEPLRTDNEVASGENPTTVRFRKFACRSDLQGRGIGSRLFEHMLSFARQELKALVVWCDSRTAAAAWYEKRGMERFGDVFYNGPVEYCKMKMVLNQWYVHL
jgi:GNAT superfamily N-acetyltransferase